MMFLDCPAYLDQDGAARCGLPAEVSRRFTKGSTDEPLEGAVIRCAASSKPSASTSLTLKEPARRPPRRSRPARPRGTVGTGSPGADGGTGASQDTGGTGSQNSGTGGGGGGGASYTGGVWGAIITDGVAAPDNVPNGEVIITYTVPVTATATTLTSP